MSFGKSLNIIYKFSSFLESAQISLRLTKQ